MCATFPNLTKLKSLISARHCFIALSFLLSGLSSQAKNYYFSSSTGNDSYTAAQAQSQTTPWKSISKLNSYFSSLVAGDAVYFKRGDVFYGGIVVTKSGASGSPIMISAYGSGARPVISGFTTLSSWTAVGNGVYQSTAANISNTVNMVSLNNMPQAIGRYPNINATNGGYLNFESSTSTSITDNTLSSSTNWTGAELVIRKAKHVIERWPISSHSGTTITYVPAKNAYPTTNNGFSYFIQKDVRTLDQLGEWFYNTSTKYLQMYFGTASPSSYSVEVSTNDILLNTSKYSYISVSELAFEGANTNAINIGSTTTTSSNIIVSNCDIDLSGASGIYGTNADYSTIQYCNVRNSYSNGIEFENEGGVSTFANINHNNVDVSGGKPGMGAISGISYQGITAYCSDAKIEYNNVDSAGYIGIAFYYNNAKIRNNLITNFCYTKDDGGGIYTWTGPVGGPVYTGREIKNNILINGIGAEQGTPIGLKTVYGIYMDDGVVGVDISGNSVTRTPEAGLYIHNTHEVNITNNTVYDCELNQILFVHDNITPSDPLRNVNFKNNIMVAKTVDQLCFNIRTVNDDINQTGPTDSNYFSRPVDDDVINGGLSSVIKTNYSVERWKANFPGKDMNSKQSPKAVLPYKINSLSSNLLTNGDFLSGITGLTFWSQNSNQTAAWDNSSKLTGTGSLKLGFPTSLANIYTIITKSVGLLNLSKNYIVRFTTLGTTPDGLMRVYLSNNLTGAAITPKQVAGIGTTKKAHEFYFSGLTLAVLSSLIIEVQQNSGTTYIDNIEVFDANITPVNIDDQFRFEYNATETAKTISLDGKYIGVDATSYNGTITLAPYTSKVLFRDGAVTSGGGTSSDPLSATGTAPAISCYGGSTKATVAGVGGTAPYTGTGSYTVTAGTGSLKISTDNPLANNYTSLYSSIGAVSNAKTYVLKFSTLGTQANGTLRAALRLTNSPYTYITGNQSHTFGTTRVDHQFTFTAPTASTDASFIIDILQSSGTVYVDNIAVFETAADGTLISDNLYGSSGQFESGISDIYTWSPSDNHDAAFDQTSKISNTYYYPVTDAKGSIATATVAVTQPSAALKATSTANPVTSTGGTTSVVVTATGGTSPYTGTGSFTGVKVGTYNYTVTDALGCSFVTNITVTQSSGTGGGTSTPLSVSAAATAIKCFGGTTVASVTGSGGQSPYIGTGSFIVNAGKGSLKVSAPTPIANNYTLLYASIGDVSSSKTYVLRFSTLGTTSNGSVRACIVQTNSPWAYIAPKQTASFGTTRVDHEFKITGPATTADASFIIEILQTSGTTYVDNIAFFEATSDGVPTSDNLYSSGQFESGIQDITLWSISKNHVAEWDQTSKISNVYNFPVVDAAGTIGVATAKISQPAVALKALATAGTVTGSTTTVTVSATGGTPPYSGTGSFTGVRVGTYNYTVTDAMGCISTVTINVTKAAARAASTPAARSIGSGSLTVVADDIQKEFTATVFPNPSTTRFDLTLEGGTTDAVDISVMSADGKLIYKTTGGSNKRYNFGDKFVSGMYFIKVVQGKTVKTLKAVKTNM